jgi:hypothetical protein
MRNLFVQLYVDPAKIFTALQYRIWYPYINLETSLLRLDLHLWDSYLKLHCVPASIRIYRNSNSTFMAFWIDKAYLLNRSILQIASMLSFCHQFYIASVVCLRKYISCISSYCVSLIIWEVKARLFKLPPKWPFSPSAISIHTAISLIRDINLLYFVQVSVSCRLWVDVGRALDGYCVSWPGTISFLARFNATRMAHIF